MTDTPRETPEILTVRERLSARIRGLVSRGEEICNAFQSRPHDDGGLASLCACCDYGGDTHLLRDALLRIEYYAAECDTLRAQLADSSDVFPAIEDVLAKYCRGSCWERTTRANVAALLDRILCLDAKRQIDMQDLKRRAEQAEAQLAAREGEIATLTKENDELTRRVTMAEQQPRSAASTNETAPCDCTRHRHCPRCHGAGCISDGPNFSHCIECGHEWRHDQPEASDARPTPVEEGTATGSATKCLSCAALTERLNQLVTSLGMVYHCDPTGDGTAPGWRNHRAEKAEARADTAEAQLRAQERNDK